MNYNAHKAFVEGLRKQISSKETSAGTKDTTSSGSDICREELKRELDAKFDALFAEIEALDDDDDD